MLTVNDILFEIVDRIHANKEDMENAKSAGVNLPGFNQPLGAYDELQSLKQWIVDELGDPDGLENQTGGLE